MKKEKIVISLGGSIVVPKEGIDIKFLKAFKALILSELKRGKEFVIVVGGGTTARNYIQAAKTLEVINSEAADYLGIEATKLNARLIGAIFGSKTLKKPIFEPLEAVKEKKPIILASGYKPGRSTDYMAVLLAERFGAKKLINLSNITHVYNKDPKKYPDAKKLENISWVDFSKIVGTKWKPGLNAPFDPIASLKAKKIKLEVAIADGRDIKNLKNYLQAKKFKGTIIK